MSTTRATRTRPSGWDLDRWTRPIAIALVAGLLIPVGVVVAGSDECVGEDAGPGNGGGSTPLTPQADCNGSLGGSDAGDAYHIRVPFQCRGLGSELIPDTCYVHVGVENGDDRDIYFRVCQTSGDADWHIETQWFPDDDDGEIWTDNFVWDRDGDGCAKIVKHFDETPRSELQGSYYVAVEASGQMTYHMTVDIVH